MNTPKHRQQWILEQLTERPALSFSECFSEYSVIYSRTEKTFSIDWNKATVKHKERQQAINAAKEQAIISEEVEAAKNGLKTKLERMASIQAHILTMEEELRVGTVTETRFDKSINKPVQYVRKMRTSEVTMIRKTLRDFHVELSKMQGDYAAEKIDLDGEFGTVLVLPSNGRNE